MIRRLETTSVLRRAAWSIALVFIFLGAASIRFSLPLWPFGDGDTWGYLRPATSQLAGDGFQHTYGRNFVYPGFLLVVCGLGRTVAAITIVQHLLGLATGGLLLACWRELARFVQAVPRALHAAAGLFLVAIYLYARTPIVFEHLIRPEAITPFFAILNIFLTLRFFARRSAHLGGAALANSVLLLNLKNSFALAILFSALPVVVVLLRRRQFLALALPALLAVALALTERTLAQDDAMAREFVPKTLFTIHANIIAREMAAEIARGDCAPYDCAQLREIHASLQAEMADSWRQGKQYRRFRFDPDYLFYHSENFRAWRGRFFEGDESKELAFLRDWYGRALTRQPTAMTRKILGQLAIFYAPLNPSFHLRRAENLSTLYQRTGDAIQGHDAEIAKSPLLIPYLAAARELSASPGAVRQSYLVIAVTLLLALLYLPVLSAVLVAAIVLFCRHNLRARYTLFAAVVLFLFSYNFGCSLLTAIVHSLHQGRYSVTQFSFTLLAIFGGLFFLAELALPALRRRLRR